MSRGNPKVNGQDCRKVAEPPALPAHPSPDDAALDPTLSRRHLERRLLADLGDARTPFLGVDAQRALALDGVILSLVDDGELGQRATQVVGLAAALLRACGRELEGIEDALPGTERPGHVCALEIGCAMDVLERLAPLLDGARAELARIAAAETGGAR